MTKMTNMSPQPSDQHGSSDAFIESSREPRREARRDLRVGHERLRQTASELHEILRALPDLYFRLASDGTIEDYTAAQFSDYYVPPEVFLDKRMQDVLPPNVGRQFEEAIQEVLKTNSIVNIEYALPMSGGVRFYEARLLPLSDNQIVMGVRGKTGRKQMEDALAHTYAELEERVEERTDELVRVNARLNQEIAERQVAEEQVRALNITLEQRVADRTRELSALYAISAVANRAENMQALLDEALAQTMAAMRSEAGAIFLLDDADDPTGMARLRVAAHQGIPTDALSRKDALLSGGGIFQNVLGERVPLLIPDLTDDSRAPEEMRAVDSKALLVVPLQVEGKALGVAGLMRPAGRGFNVEEVALLSTIGDQIGLAVQRLHLRARAQQAMRLGERQRLARDLHDSVTQSLYGLVTLTEAGVAQLESGDLKGTSRTFIRIGETTRQALKEMRLFIHQSRPAAVEQEGLVGALHLRLASVEGRSGVHTQMQSEEAICLPLPVESALYQIAEEALNNILRHAHATPVMVRLCREGEQVILEVEDNGRGFDPDRVSDGGMGLGNIRELAREIGGVMEIRSVLGGGTKVKVTVGARSEDHQI